MPKKVCPQCGVRLSVPSGSTLIKCYKCKSTFPVSDAVAAAAAGSKNAPAIAAGVIILTVIGLIMSMQPVSLMTGSASIWLGVAVAGVGTALAFFLGAPTWVRIVAPIVLVIALVNVLSVEHQMSLRRDNISRTLNR